jgi:hypothetical protein
MLAAVSGYDEAGCYVLKSLKQFLRVKESAGVGTAYKPSVRDERNDTEPEL